MELASPNNSFEFTPEQIRVLRNHHGDPLQVPVKEINTVYRVIEKGVIPTLDDDYVREGLTHAADQAARGDESDWDVEEIKAAGRELLLQQKRHA